VEAAFRQVGLDWREHTVTDKCLFRPTEIMIGRSNASKATERIGWKAKYHMESVARMMIEAD
jgi:GDPmannose 4,6-dehydratase